MNKCNKKCYYKIFGFGEQKVKAQQVQSVYEIRKQLVDSAITSAAEPEERQELEETVNCLETASRVLSCNSMRRAYNKEHESFEQNHSCQSFRAAINKIKEIRMATYIRELERENQELKRTVEERDRTITELHAQLGQRQQEVLEVPLLNESGFEALAQPTDSFTAFIEGLERPLSPGQAPQEPTQSSPLAANLSPERQEAPVPISSPVRRSSPRPSAQQRRRTRRKFVPSRDQTTCIIAGLKFRSQGAMMVVKFSEDDEQTREIHAEDIVEAFEEEARVFMRRLQEKRSPQLKTIREKGLTFLLNLL